MGVVLTLLRWLRNIAGFLGGLCLLGLVLAPIITLFDKNWDPPAPFSDAPATLGTYMWQTAVFMIGAFIVWWLAGVAAMALLTRAGAFDEP